MAKVQTPNKQVHNMNSPEKLEAIKSAIIAGESPRSIHEKFGTSIVNIYYHKDQLKKQGLLGDTAKKANTTKKVVTPKETKSSAKAATKVAKSTASAKTKTSTKTTATKAPKVTAKTAAKPTKVKKVDSTVKAASQVNAATGKGLVNIVVNGTKISTDKPVKSYKISKKSVIIEF